MASASGLHSLHTHAASKPQAHAIRLSRPSIYPHASGPCMCNSSRLPPATGPRCQKHIYAPRTRTGRRLRRRCRCSPSRPWLCCCRPWQCASCGRGGARRRGVRGPCPCPALLCSEQRVSDPHHPSKGVSERVLQQGLFYVHLSSLPPWPGPLGPVGMEKIFVSCAERACCKIIFVRLVCRVNRADLLCDRL